MNLSSCEIICCNPINNNKTPRRKHSFLGKDFLSLNHNSSLRAAVTVQTCGWWVSLSCSFPPFKASLPVTKASLSKGPFLPRFYLATPTP